jgi:hypothetical protein
MKYKVTIPITPAMPMADYVVSDKTMETKEEEALWHYNRSRDHDGLPPVSKLPMGTTFRALPPEH